MNKKQKLTTVAIILWGMVITPMIRLVLKCINAYYYGVRPGFNEGRTFYGMQGFRVKLKMEMFYGFVNVILWGILFIVAVIFTIWMTKKRKEI